MKKILFHICCGPCATASVKKIKENGFEVVGYYYNPNIHPDFEYRKRLKEAQKLAVDYNFRLEVADYEPKEYFDAIKGNEENMEKRCISCWKLRIEKTAKRAKELGIETIGTTLRISPYQNQEELLKIGSKIAKKNGLEFYQDDLVSCFSESVSISKEKSMYRQKYCGCIFSRDYR